MNQAPLTSDVEPRERVREILRHMDRFDNTVQYSWFLDIARTFLGFKRDRIRAEAARTDGNSRCPWRSFRCEWCSAPGFTPPSLSELARS